MSEVKIWDNGAVHVVKGAKGVVISLPNDAAHCLAMLMWRHENEAAYVPEGREDLDALMEALCCLLFPHPRSLSRPLPNRYITTLAEAVKRT